MANELFQRLPKLCTPLRYAIELKPCLKTFTFTGKQSVTLNINEGASELVFNAKKLSITQAKLNGMIIETINKPEQEKCVIPLKLPSLSGSAVLDLKFDGVISDKMVGLYRSVYKDDTGEEKVMLATHFEPSDARQAFPCWDEPDFKSVFSITLVVPQHLSAISNMPLCSKVDQDNHCVSYSFEDTPKMSSYLVAFAIGEFEYVEARDSDNVLVRVYSRPGLVSELGRGEFALDTACRSLPFFGDYFGVRYPLPKLDMLAIPDFAGGAMENWGLVTYRERTLLAEKNTSSPATKQIIALTVSHELAHMWFGNLATMFWWTDLWLKEGFATWIEYLCVNHCFPEMEIWTHFTYSELASALRLDALVNSHPIEVEVHSPDEIDEIFDTISYCKGASLIHMLHSYLGEINFRAGLCAYLSKFAYANATTEDLWTALESVSGVPVGSIMRPWTTTAGFPVVFVKPLSVQDQCVRVELKQTQYRLPSSAGKCPNDARVWPVPVVLTCYSTDGRHRCTHRHLLTASEGVVELPLHWPVSHITDCLVQINTDATGFYHCCYTSEQLSSLVKHSNLLNWSTSTRVAFINDGFALSKAGFIRISDWLTLLPQLVVGESSYPVWRCLLVDGLGTYVSRMVHEGDLSLPAYHAFLRKLTRPVLDKLAFFHTDERSDQPQLSHDARRLRSLLVLTAGAEACDADVIAEAKRRFDIHRGNNTDQHVVPSDLRGAIYATVVRHYADSDVIDHLMKVYHSVKSPEERSDILCALGAASENPPDSAVSGGDPSLASSPLKQVLRFCLDSQGPVRDQDRVHGLQVCASWSSAARLTTWEAVKSNWSRLTEVYQGQFLLAYLIKGVLSGFSTEARIKEVKTFFEQNPVTCHRAVKQVHETLDTNWLLLQRDGPLISNALKQLVQNE